MSYGTLPNYDAWLTAPMDRASECYGDDIAIHYECEDGIMGHTLYEKDGRLVEDAELPCDFSGEVTGTVLYVERSRDDLYAEVEITCPQCGHTTEGTYEESRWDRDPRI